ncbi:helix-turn-helix domain-containing protein [Pedobacter sp.]|uniref:helix-turn-helix domain-containing protein n=1 Tax=Pedobacter sp. TaxID=1411316 RepID=UPI0035622869
MAYRHVSEEERKQIYRWKHDGYNMRKIGELLNRHRSTLQKSASSPIATALCLISLSC